MSQRVCCIFSHHELNFLPTAILNNQKKDTNESRLPDDTMQNTPKEIRNKNTSQKTFAGSFTLSMIQLVYPTKFNTNIVFAFSWDECNTQEKLKTILIKKKIGGKPARKLPARLAKKHANIKHFFTKLSNIAYLGASAKISSR